MTTEEPWPTLEQVDAAPLGHLLAWNETLPRPEFGSDHHHALVRIVERLREVQDGLPEGEELPEPDHPGWPS